MGQGIDQGEGHFLLFDVNAAGFARPVHDLIIEQIVLDLKGNAQKRSELPHPIHLFLTSAPAVCAYGTTSGDQGGGLSLDDVVIDRFVDIQPTRFFDLQELPLTHHSDGIRYQ